MDLTVPHLDKAWFTSEQGIRAIAVVLTALTLGLSIPMWRRRFSLGDRQAIKATAREIRAVAAEHDIISDGEPRLDPEEVGDAGVTDDQIMISPGRLDDGPKRHVHRPSVDADHPHRLVLDVRLGVLDVVEGERAHVPTAFQPELAQECVQRVQGSRLIYREVEPVVRRWVALIRRWTREDRSVAGSSPRHDVRCRVIPRLVYDSPHTVQVPSVIPIVPTVDGTDSRFPPAVGD